MNFEIAPKLTELKLKWDDARLYCFSLDVDGKTGWRLPTKEELNEIFQSRNDFEKWFYWTSTEFNGNRVWHQDFGYGGHIHGKKNYDSYYVRAIRDLKDNS